MAQHVTVVLGNGSKSHFHTDSSPMYDSSEGILVIDDLSGATVNFNTKEFVLAWITSEMTDDEVHAYRQQIEDAKNGVKPESEGGLDDGNDGRVGV
jgi:hypothetical protein